MTNRSRITIAVLGLRKASPPNYEGWECPNAPNGIFVELQPEGGYYASHGYEEKMLDSEDEALAWLLKQT